MGIRILRFLWVQSLLMTIGSHLLIKVIGKNGMRGLLKIICSMDSGKISQLMLSSSLCQISPFLCLGGGSNSSVHVIPGGGPVQVMLAAQPQVNVALVNNVPEDFVLVEEVEESDDESFQPAGQNLLAPLVEPFNPLPVIFSQLLALADKPPASMVNSEEVPSQNDPAIMLLEIASIPLANTAGKKRCRGGQKEPVSVAEVRRCTRLAAKMDGYKLEPMKDQPEPKKKPKSAKPRKEEAVSPPTPVKVLQSVGIALEISSDDLTMEKLMAAPSGTSPSAA
jgi:hypothetical protein